MGVLLDTHAFLWWITDDARLSTRARAAIVKSDEVLLSIASCWEMAIKSSLGKLTLPSSLERFIAEQLAANGFGLLAAELEHVALVSRLPFHHRDPFDRLLAAQAAREKLSLVSADPVFRKYGVTRVW